MRLRETSLRLWDDSGSARSAAVQFLESAFDHSIATQRSAAQLGLDKTQLAPSFQVLSLLYGNIRTILSTCFNVVLGMFSGRWSPSRHAED